MTNPAIVADLSARSLRELSTRELGVAQAWLNDAYGLLLARRPNLEAQMEDETVKRADVIRIVVAMVARVFSNPDGLLEERIDDYSYRRDSLVSGGALHVTADELADVTPGRRSRRSMRLISYGEFPR